MGLHQYRNQKPKEPPTTNGELRPFNTISQTAAFLNMKVSTLRRYKKDGLLKPAKNMRANADMFSKQEVERFRDYLIQQQPLQPVQAQPPASSERLKKIDGLIQEVKDSQELEVKVREEIEKRYPPSEDLKRRRREIQELKEGLRKSLSAKKSIVLPLD